MKILHILRSAPAELTKKLIAQSGGTQIALYGGKVDYDRLVTEIFSADKVICWW